MSIRAFALPFVVLAVCGVAASLVGRTLAGPPPATAGEGAGPEPTDEPPPTLSLANFYYVPELNLLTFTVKPDRIDPGRFKLLVQSKPGEDPIAALPLKSYDPPDYPVVVQIGRETGLRKLSTVTTVSPKGRSVEAPPLYAVNVATIPPGRYRVRLDGSPRAAGMSATTVEVPERQALLALAFPRQGPRELKVGDVFDVTMSLTNSGPASAQGVEVTLFLSNQQFQSVDPATPVRQEGDRAILTVPDVPTGATLSFRLRYRAAAAEEKLRLIARVKPNRLEHPKQRNKDISTTIGQISPR